MYASHRRDVYGQRMASLTFHKHAKPGVYPVLKTYVDTCLQSTEILHRWYANERLYH